MRRNVVLMFAAVAVLGCASQATIDGSLAQRDAGGFVAMLGNDTVSVEQFTITGNSLRTEAVTRSPRTAIRTMLMSWDDQGRITAMDVRDRAPDAHPDSLRSRTQVAVGADSVRWTTTSGGQQRYRAAPAAAFHSFFAPPLFAPYEVMLRNLVARDGASAVMTTGGGQFDFTVGRPHADTIAITDANLGTLRFRVDRLGRIQGVDATNSTTKYTVTRVPQIDVSAWAREFAARDVAGRGLGPLSIRDSVRASVGAATVAIDYHRPAKRGRVVFPGVVPFGQVWRTGANQATSFTTSRDLMVGGVHVPAGTYTLWTIPGPNEWRLIINKQTGQWGTVYNAAQNLAEIPMRVEPARDPVELFTIQFEPRTGGATGQQLVLMWDRTRAIVPVEAM